MFGTHDGARLLCAVVTSAWSFAAVDRPDSAEDRSPRPPVAVARVSAAGCILPRSVPIAPMARAPGEDRHVSNCCPGWCRYGPLGGIRTGRWPGQPLSTEAGPSMTRF